MQFSNSLKETQKLQTNGSKTLCQYLFHNPESQMFGKDISSQLPYLYYLRVFDDDIQTALYKKSHFNLKNILLQIVLSTFQHGFLYRRACLGLLTTTVKLLLKFIGARFLK